MNAPLVWWCSLLLALAPAVRAQTPSSAAASSADRPIQLAARDSLVLVFDEVAGDTASLYGDAKITYGEVTLDAYRIDVLLDLDLLEARGLATDTGVTGRPTFLRGSERFESDVIAFNLTTQRGRFQGARTQLDDGFLKARVVAVDEDSTAYARDGVYTTCGCVDDPSYSLRASQLKVEDKWIYTGPIQLYLFNIPTPLWLPFGVLPNIEGRRAGPLAPQYGEDERGFYLRDFGWYWPLSDYADLQLRGGFWTGGSWEIQPTFRYARRYAYNGTLALSYGVNRRGEKTDRDFLKQSTSSIRWNHSQQFGQRASLSGNVNLSSQNYLRTSSAQFDDRVRQTVSSAVTYQTRFPRSGRSLTLNVAQQQQLQTGSVNLTLPTLTFSQNERRPFRRGTTSGGRESLLESISYRYSGQVTNRFAFTPAADTVLINRGDPGAADIGWFEALLSPARYRRATLDDGTGFDFNATHTIPVNASFQMDRLPLVGIPFRVTVVPSFDYRETWYLSTERIALDTAGVARRREQTGFFALRQFGSSLSANTTVYGLFPFQAGPYNGLRHTVRPTLGFTYQPDFSRPTWGYTRTYIDATGRPVRYPIVRDVRQGQVAALTLNLDNVFETRRVETDTTGATRRTPSTLLNLSVSTNYNFAADSLRLAPINVRARTRLFGQVDVNFSSIFSPYGFGNEATTPVFNLRQLSLARLTSLTLTASTRLASRRQGAPRPSQQAAFEGVVPGATRGGLIDPQDDGFYDPRRAAATTIGRAPYADFSIPWSLSADLSYGLDRRPLLDATTGTFRLDSQPRAIFNTSFDFSLTPNWKVQGRSGYDFIEQDFSTSNLSVLRDFECWEMSFQWIPFGRYQSYSFTLQVKSGKLRELLRLDQPRSRTPGIFGR